MIAELGSQALRWMLQVDVPVRRFRETTVHETPKVQVVERPPFIEEAPMATLAAHEFVTGMMLCCEGCFASETVSRKKEDVVSRSCSRL